MKHTLGLGSFAHHWLSHPLPPLHFFNSNTCVSQGLGSVCFYSTFAQVDRDRWRREESRFDCRVQTGLLVNLCCKVLCCTLPNKFAQPDLCAPCFGPVKHWREITRKKLQGLKLNARLLLQWKRNKTFTTFSMNSTQMKVFEVDLLHCCIFFFTSSLLCLLWSQCEYWMEAAAVEQSHALAEKKQQPGSNSQNEMCVIYLKSCSNWVGGVINLAAPECHSGLDGMFF